MVSVWPREYMATHSLTGGKSSKKDKPEKQPVDPVTLNIIQSMIFICFQFHFWNIHHYSCWNSVVPTGSKF